MPRSSSYSDDSSGDSSDEDEDATLKAMRAAARAKALRAKFEEWENTQDAKEQMKQMMLTDENGDSIETASNLKAKFEALKLLEEAEQQPKPPIAAAERKKFVPKRFKVFA